MKEREVVFVEKCFFGMEFIQELKVLPEFEDLLEKQLDGRLIREHLTDLQLMFPLRERNSHEIYGEKVEQLRSFLFDTPPEKIQDMPVPGTETTLV